MPYNRAAKKGFLLTFSKLFEYINILNRIFKLFNTEIGDGYKYTAKKGRRNKCFELACALFVLVEAMSVRNIKMQTLSCRYIGL